MINFLENRWFNIALFVGVFLFLSANSQNISIFVIDEARNAECAREMLEQKSWIVPQYNYALRTDKPPLHYYFMMLAYSLFGVSEWSARLFSAAMGAATVTMTFRFVRRHRSTAAAGWTLAVLLSSFFFMNEFRLAVPDPYLIYGYAWSLMSFFSFFQTQRRSFLWQCYVAASFATMAKGPVAPALLGLSILVFLMAQRKFTLSFLRQLQLPQGIFLFLVAVVPWYVLVHHATDGAWTRGFFLEHNLDRFSNEMEGHGGIFLLTWGYVLLGLLPFAFFLFPAIRFAWKQQSDALINFLLVCSIVVIGFFSISNTRLPHYTMPVYPFLAILIGIFIKEKLFTYSATKKYAWIFIVTTILFLAATISAKIVLTQEHSLANISNIAYWLVLITVVNIISTILWLTKKPTSALLSFVSGGALLLLLLAFVLFPAVSKQNPVLLARPHLGKQPMVYWQRYNQSFPFYIKRQLPYFEKENELEVFLKKNPNTYILTQTRDFNKLKNKEHYEVIFSAKDIFELPTSIIVKQKAE